MIQIETVTEGARLIERLGALFAERPEVVAVALGGSRASDAADAASDIDLYVYTRAEIPVEAREAMVARAGGATRADMAQNYWGPSDQWFDAATGVEVDAVYFDAAWMDDQVRRVLRDHRPSLGYTTAFCHTVRHSRPLHDPDGWFTALQMACAAPYPEELRRAIIAWNRPLLRDIITSYAAQIEKALQRDDRVSLNHRLAALLASYFDILFAFNRVWHPGEKRLVARASALCERLPEGMADDLEAVLAAAGTADPALTLHLHRLLDRLDALLAADGLI